tara:strand:- start:2069 stop:2416 length:348 start_codon:yes stop_codon:yes gene_type:complete
MREIIFENTKFLIGQNSQENWNLLDSCNKINNEYIWFHLNSFPSCYVIMCSPLNDISCIESKNILLNYGAELCKQNTKYRDLPNLKICYTSLKKLKKTNKIGEVIIIGKPNVIKL